MTLTLHYHPLASFCHKVLIPLYENGTAFDGHIVDLGDAGARAAFYALSPVGKMPVLRDEARDRTVSESSIVIEYLDQHYPGADRMIPASADEALEVRWWDRFLDLYVHEPMQKIVTDRLRPEGKNDFHGVELARAQIESSYRILEDHLADREWVAARRFSMADCAAAPALFYAGKVAPFEKRFSQLALYYERLLARPSFKRVIDEAQPYFALFPG